MLNILLVDDELLSRAMLKSMLEWEEYGFHICGECSDGTMAVQMIKSQKPDIVITDIKMKHMDGDELVEYVHHNHPEICTIVLSGYDDYEHVRRTLTNDAVDYLIKNTLDKEILLKSLEKAKKKLESGQSIPKSRKNLTSLRQKFLSDILSGMHDKTTEELIEEGRMLNMNFVFRNMYPVFIGFGSVPWPMQDKSLHDEILVKFSVNNVIEEIASEQQIPCQIYIMDEKNYVMLTSMEEKAGELEAHQELTRLLQRIEFCMQKYLNMSIYYSIGRKSNLSNLPKHYKELEKEWIRGNLRKNLSGSWQKEGNDVQEEREYRQGNGLLLEEEKRLVQALEAGEIQEITALMEEIFGDIQQQGISKQGCVNLFNDFTILLLRLCKEKGIKTEDVCKQKVPLGEICAQFRVIDEYRKFYEESFITLSGMWREKMESEDFSLLVKRAVQWIKKHFKEEISLNEAADALGVSVPYLSKCINEELMESFPEYLNGLRLEYAKELLVKSDKKIKEIAKEAAFYNYPYFITLFKRKYGLTPKEYKKIHGSTIK